jgi:hypothetical protein
MPGFNIAAAGGGGEDGGGVSHTVEIARKHRFKLDILEPLSSGSTLLFLEKCTRPSPEFEEVTIHNGQDEIYRPGKNKWMPIEFTFYEKLNGNVNQPVELINKWYADLTAILKESRHTEAQNYYKNAELQMLDGEGDPIWTYFIYDCWPQKVSPSDLAYSDSDLATVSVILRFNKAQEKQKR